MPQYSYKCSNETCQEVRDLTASVDERGAWEGKPCITCADGVMRRVFTPYNILNAGIGDII